MKCTDRELLEKLLRLKERADQRRGALRAHQERLRARHGAPGLQTHVAAPPRTRTARDIPAVDSERASAAATLSPEPVGEGSIRRWVPHPAAWPPAPRGELVQASELR